MKLPVYWPVTDQTTPKSERDTRMRKETEVTTVTERPGTL